MKRDANIIYLSRDHHLGLLFCWKIRQGLKLDIDAERIGAYVQHFWAHHLRQHFYEEENILFTDRKDSSCARAIEEHGQIKQLITGMSAPEPQLLLQIADLTDNHIRYEERELFPYLEKKLATEQLNEIGAKLQALHEHPHEDDFEDEFWKV